jgi:AcrR family transcriptional regulator
LELIAEKGFHGAPMSMIAEKSGVAVGTIYRYFENKDVLINTLYHELEEKIMVSLRDATPRVNPSGNAFSTSPRPFSAIS